MIQTAGLGFCHKRRALLDGVSLRAAPDAATALLGGNGSGKSFLLRVLATEFRPTSGSATVSGFDLVRQARQVARSVGYVGEPLAMPAHATVRGYLDAFASVHGIPRGRRAETVRDALALFDLEPPGDRLAVSLSRGETQRLELARALLHDPPVFLLDDPLVGLDPTGQAETLEVLRELRDLGKTLLVATNLPELYGDLFARGVVMVRGRVVAEGTLEELLAPFAPAEPATWRSALLRWLAREPDNEPVPETTTTTGGER